MRSRSPWIAMLVVGVTALACDPFRASADEDPAPTAESDAAAPPSDGAAPDDAAAASALCEGTHFLCDDFGRGALGDPARWPRSENVAAFTFSTDAPKSAPRAIEVTGSDGAFAYLGKRTAGGVSAVTCDLELRLPALLPEASRVDLLKLELATPEDIPEDFTDVVFSAAPSELAFNAHHSYSNADEGYVSASLGATPTDGGWHHVRITLSTTR